MNNKDYEFGLEPPKVYNEHGSAENGRRKQQKKNKNVSTNEKRRRQNKKRRLKNSVRKALVTICLLITLIAVGTVLSLTVFFKIETVNISGSGMYSSEEITENSNINIGDNLFLVNKGKCAESLEKNLPYIYDVDIKRKLPSTLIINVTEAAAAYMINNGDETYTLLDDRFKVLDNAYTAGTEGLTEIRNTAFISNENGSVIEFENAESADGLGQLSEIITKLNITEITAISSDGKNNNYIVYENRIILNLGSFDDVENKIYRGIAGCEKLNESDPNARGTMVLSTGKQFYFTLESS